MDSARDVSPSGVRLYPCRTCRTPLLPEDKHDRCFICLGWQHQVQRSSCPACAALPSEESELRAAFMAPVSPVQEDTDAGPAEENLPPAQAHQDWAEAERDTDSRSDSWSSSEKGTRDGDSVSTASGRRSSQREPVDLLPHLFAVAAVRTELPLPPQPAPAPRDFVLGLASQSRARARTATLCPPVPSFVRLVQRDWDTPLAAKAPARGYLEYSNVDGWPAITGVPTNQVFGFPCPRPPSSALTSRSASTAWRLQPEARSNSLPISSLVVNNGALDAGARSGEGPPPGAPGRGTQLADLQTVKPRLLPRVLAS